MIINENWIIKLMKTTKGNKMKLSRLEDVIRSCIFKKCNPEDNAFETSIKYLALSLVNQCRSLGNGISEDDENLFYKFKDSVLVDLLKVSDTKIEIES
jgi:hypothetical protein